MVEELYFVSLADFESLIRRRLFILQPNGIVEVAFLEPQGYTRNFQAKKMKGGVLLIALPKILKSESGLQNAFKVAQGRYQIQPEMKIVDEIKPEGVVIALGITTHTKRMTIYADNGRKERKGNISYQQFYTGRYLGSRGYIHALVLSSDDLEITIDPILPYKVIVLPEEMWTPDTTYVYRLFEQRKGRPSGAEVELIAVPLEISDAEKEVLEENIKKIFPYDRDGFRIRRVSYAFS